jgi:hypothetical protein
MSLQVEDYSMHENKFMFGFFLRGKKFGDVLKYPITSLGTIKTTCPMMQELNP